MLIPLKHAKIFRQNTVCRIEKRFYFRNSIQSPYKIFSVRPYKQSAGNTFFMERNKRNQLDAIQGHINRNYNRWFERYSGIAGVNVGLKIINKNEIADCYSIVFHVTRKSKYARKKVPAFLPVRINNRIKKIPTDVIDSGVLKLQNIQIGDKAKNERSASVGTVSFFFTGSGGTYICSNMHVLGANLLAANKLNFDIRKGDSSQTIKCFNDIISAGGQLIVGRYGGIDVAFAKLNNPAIAEKVIKGAGPASGFFQLTNANFQTAKTKFFGSTSGTTVCRVVALGAVKDTIFTGVMLKNLIKLNLCSLPGDSGSAVYDEKRRIVGIIVGSDTLNSFAVHIDDVIDFFQTSKL
jgi:hypothetical protein